MVVLQRCGRIEGYFHGDAITPNKGGSLVRVLCETDFAARTDEFIAFAKYVAKMAYAASATDWQQIIAVYPDAADRLACLQTLLRERIEVSDILLLTLTRKG